MTLSTYYLPLLISAVPEYDTNIASYTISKTEYQI